MRGIRGELEPSWTDYRHSFGVRASCRSSRSTPKLHCSRASVRLLRGEFQSGVARLRVAEQVPGISRACLQSQPTWDGSPLVRANDPGCIQERGTLGDILQFIRFAARPSSKTRGRRRRDRPSAFARSVTCSNRTPSIIDQLIPRGGATAATFDVRLPCMKALPRMLGTTLATIPAHGFPCLAFRRAWRPSGRWPRTSWPSQVAAGKFKIGVCWRGEPQIRTPIDNVRSTLQTARLAGPIARRPPRHRRLQKGFAAASRSRPSPVIDSKHHRDLGVEDSAVCWPGAFVETARWC